MKEVNECKKEDYANDTATTGVIIMSIVVLFMLILYIASIVHASIRLCTDAASNNIKRILMLLVAIFLFPLYFIIYPIIYYSGGFNIQ